MLLGTRMTNNEPSAITDLDVVARYDATDPNYVVKDSSNRISALLDKSKRLAFGNELLPILDFNSWNSGNVDNITKDSFSTTAAGGVYKSIPLTIGKVYVLTITYTSNVQVQLYKHTTPSSEFLINSGVPFVAVNNNIYIRNSNVGITSVLSISIKEVLGNHITQTDITKMPIHTNRYNLLTYSEFPNGLTDTTYNVNVISQNFTPFSNGIRFPSSPSAAYKRPSSLTVGSTYVFSVYIKMDNGLAPKFESSLYSSVDNECNLIVIGLLTNPLDYKVDSIGNGIYRVSVKFTAQEASGNLGISRYSGNNTEPFVVSGYQLEQSNFAGKYQRINAANDYDTNGFEYYAQFDGVNDYLQALPFNLNQPTSIYSCLKQNTNVLSAKIFDSYSVNRMYLLQRNVIGTLRMYSGNSLDNSTITSIGAFNNIYTCYNSVLSKFKINNKNTIVGDAGALNSDGFTLGAGGGTPNGFSSIEVKEIIIKKIATDESDTIFNYFKNKHNVQY